MRTKLPTIFVLPLLAMACFGAATRATEGMSPPDRSHYGDPAEYELRDRPVTMDDVRILVRASELLTQESAWIRSDDRRVALQEVRFAIQETTQGREFEHRLMEFNNLPETSSADVQAVLKTARAGGSAIGRCCADAGQSPGTVVRSPAQTTPPASSTARSVRQTRLRPAALARYTALSAA